MRYRSIYNYAMIPQHISIVIATYNSEKTLPLVLASIRNQTYPRKHIEIVIVDGGSVDATLQIARQYKCKIIHNPNVEPLYAKYLGFIHSKGKYIEYIDHDEVIVNENSIRTRIHIFEKFSDVKALTGCGYYSPSGYHIINSYISEFGDPFSFFMYSLTKHADFFMSVMKSRYTTSLDNDEFTIFDLKGSSEMPLVELVAGGGMVDRAYMLKNFPELKTKQYLLPHLLYLLLQKSTMLAITKHDPIIHYSSDTIKSYMHKLIWRIKNNIFFKKTTGISGFSGRIGSNTLRVKLRKFLFIPYALSIIIPCIDAIRLIFSRKNIGYIIHVPLTFITAVLIIYFSFLKLFGIQMQLQNYDGTVRAYEHA